jgi:hypothetical protein
MLIVAAAGNEADDVDWPAAALQPSGGGRGYGLAVGASDVDGVPASFSNSGRRLSLVAPGSREGSCTGVLVALPTPTSFENNSCYPEWAGDGGSYYGYLAGTSFAAPEVAGVAALIWSMRPELANWQVADIIKQSARREPGAGWTPTAGLRRLRCGARASARLGLARPSRGPGRRFRPRPASTQGRTGAWHGRPSWPEDHVRPSPGPDARRSPDFEVGAIASSGLRVFVHAPPASARCAARCAPLRHRRLRDHCLQPGNAGYDPRALRLADLFSSRSGTPALGPLRSVSLPGCRPSTSHVGSCGLAVLIGRAGRGCRGRSDPTACSRAHASCSS